MSRGGNLRVTGADQLRRLAVDLKVIGDAELKRELFRGIGRATKPAVPAIRSSMLATLPRRGGLAADVERTTVVRRSTRLVGRGAGVRIWADGKHDVYNLNRGRVRHPLFGDRNHWYTQEIEPGFFDHPLEAVAVRAEAEMVRVMDVIEMRLATGYRGALVG